ncbi:hypothetical protein C1A38_02370 [Verrucosispora sp. ts21]|uniref:hypothetical protein n=1 Tax=Verrucosispora sp. ts21 TaxID=2069341 RepID=UPI000C885631|nr:hypothetical protein [Verrucosispora sp. ts21]PMR62620.1 hypothetical protein C1A38_02370 [Verrucosispora sp. ts21]
MLIECNAPVVLVRQHIIERPGITSLLRERHQPLLQLTRTIQQIIINGDRHGTFIPRRNGRRI